MKQSKINERDSLFSTQNLLSRSADETRALGETVGAHLKPGDLVFLHGELGAGKTTFVSGVARGMGIESEIVSPTFVLIVEHMNHQHANRERANCEHANLSGAPLLHLDAYRLEDLDEHALHDAGIFDFLERDDAVKIVEWPSRIREFLPTPRFEIYLRSGELRSSENDNDRVLEVRDCSKCATTEISRRPDFL